MDRPLPQLEQPMHVLVGDLRRSNFVVRSATKALEASEPVLEIITPDGRHRMLVWESDYFAAPHALTARIREQLRRMGYDT